MKRIIIGGDFVPTKSNENYFINGNLENLFGKELYKIIIGADFRMFNLEAPITNSCNRINKEGPNLKINPNVINGIKLMNINLFTLANNHILDYDDEGLKDTIKILQRNSIDYVGAGKNLEDASSGYILELENVKIGIYACTEHEYTLATDYSSGANPFDPLESLDHIFELKKKVDYLIVLYHGGKEFYQYPTPYLRKVCRKIVEKGADLVLCQHSHCIGSSEDYNGGKIVYGQGNFLFDRDDKINYAKKQEGLLIELTYNNKFDIKYYALKKDKERVLLATNNESKNILTKFNRRSEEIRNNEFVIENYKRQANIDGGRYLLRLSRIGILLSKMDNLLFKGRIFNRHFKFFSKKQRQTLENILQCEVHNEIVREYIKNNY